MNKVLGTQVCETLTPWLVGLGVNTGSRRLSCSGVFIKKTSNLQAGDSEESLRCGSHPAAENWARHLLVDVVEWVHCAFDPRFIDLQRTMVSMTALLIAISQMLKR